METLKSLLAATIKYQDVLDDLLTDQGAAELHLKMLDLFEEAKKKYPAIMSGYDFGYKKDRQLEFENLQEFINNFDDMETDAKKTY